MTTRFIAICFLGAGSVYGQSATYEKSVEIAVKEAIGFAKVFGGFAKHVDPIPFNVYDYEPWDQITWSDGQVFGHTDGSSRPTPLTAVRHVWVNPHTRKATKDLSHDEWLAEIKAARA